MGHQENTLLIPGDITSLPSLLVSFMNLENGPGKEFLPYPKDVQKPMKNNLLVRIIFSSTLKTYPWDIFKGMKLLDQEFAVLQTVHLTF